MTKKTTDLQMTFTVTKVDPDAANGTDAWRVTMAATPDNAAVDSTGLQMSFILVDSGLFGDYTVGRQVRVALTPQ
jgi:hypothetical protein